MCISKLRNWFRDTEGYHPKDEEEPYVSTLKPPEGLDSINATEINTVLTSEFPDAQIFFADKNYKTTTKTELIRFLQHNRTNMHHYVSEYYDCPVPENVAYSMGLFFADGSCGFRGDTQSGAWWRITNTNKELLNKAIKGLKEIPEDDIDFKISTFDSEKKGTVTNYGIRSNDLNHIEVVAKKYGGRGKFINTFRNWYYLNKYKKIPAPIIDSQLEAKREFLNGAIDGDGHVFKSQNTGIITCKGKLAASGLIKLMMDLNWKCTLLPDKRKEDIFGVYYNRRYEKLDESKNLCDDFSFKLMGEIQNPDWGSLPFGILWVNIKKDANSNNKITGGHAVNCFIDKARTVWIIEPQDDSMFRCPKNWKAFLVII